MEVALTAIEALLGLLAQIIPTMTTNAAVANAITALIKIIPVVVQFAPQFIKDVQNIVAILESNPATLPDQIAKVKAALPADDAAFDDAVKRAEAEDDAAGE